MATAPAFRRRPRGACPRAPGGRSRASAAAGGLAGDLGGIDPVFRQRAAVLLVVARVGQLFVGLLALVVAAALAQQLEDFVFGDVHPPPPRSVVCRRASPPVALPNRGE